MSWSVENEERVKKFNMIFEPNEKSPNFPTSVHSGWIGALNIHKNDMFETPEHPKSFSDSEIKLIKKNEDN